MPQVFGFDGSRLKSGVEGSGYTSSGDAKIAQPVDFSDAAIAAQHL